MVLIHTISESDNDIQKNRDFRQVVGERIVMKALRRRRDGRVEVVDVLSGPESPPGDPDGRGVCVVRLEGGAELTIPAEEVQFIE